MHIDIAGLNKEELLIYLVRHALLCLMRKNLEHRDEYTALLDAVSCRYQVPPLVTGYLPFLPPGCRPWIEVRDALLDATNYDQMFGQGAAQFITNRLKNLKREWWGRAGRARASAATASAPERPSTSGEGSSQHGASSAAPGPGTTSGAEAGTSTSGSSGGGDEGPSTSLEKAGCSHGPHMAEGTGHHRD